MLTTWSNKMNSQKIILRINAASCLAFGVLFVVAAANVAGFLGEVPVIVIQVIGVGLLANGVLLIWASSRKSTSQLDIIWFSLGDFSWWLATLALIAAKIWITTQAGIIAALIVGLLVAFLGVMQLWALGLQNQGTSSAVHLQLIVKSWLALPNWVKIWLTGLNLVFLSVFSFWPDSLAVVTLLAYVATIPLLAGQIAYDGGLRRILGVGHLIPWLPLLYWLVLHAEQQIFVVLLGVMLVICLAFDLLDVWRFWRGERDIIGSTQKSKIQVELT
jgi:hypothetical protein